ncbi:MAG: DMT family transporter [Burkholderiales bacterium]|nr:DMT family transporter [Burkholderiales bacterium]
MSHRRAVFTMLLVTLMWSSAGVVTRHLQAARSFEVTFWRSAFTVIVLALLLPVLRGRAALARSLREGGATLWFSGACWCVMFTAFMIAITLTTVANVLVTMAIAPLLTALIARVALGHRLAARTWMAIGVAGVGIVWMYAREFSTAEPSHLLGTAVALAVPVAAAINWTLIQHTRHQADVDLLPAVPIGALLSALLTLPFALPFAASAHDLALLALLGVGQLAVPCLMSVAAARQLSAPEASLLALLEVVFGVAWAWLGAGEVPAAHVLGGGALVLVALAANEAIALRGVAR